MRRRHVRRALALLLILVALAGAGAWALLAGSLARLDGAVAGAGLDAPVEITRDALGTVTATAASRRDLAWATGWVHAQERFFQMDLQRRLAAGELAALVGAAALDNDRDIRRHRFRARAERRLRDLPAAERALLDAYRDGVNAGLAALRVRPWEYLLLRTRPEPWRSADTLLTVDAMFLDLNDGGENTLDLDLARMDAVLPAPLVRFLTAPSGRWEAPLEGPPAPLPELPAAALFDLRALEPVPAAPTDVAEPAHPGSNSFAVSGALAGGGGGILAGDMHLGLGVPNIWFRMRLRLRGAERIGADLNGLTLPGTPALISGTNGAIAWAFTNSYGDWMDWVRVTLDPDDPERYRVPGGWAPLEVHAERIEVKGDSAETLEVRETRWGPILAEDADGTPLALAWTAHHPRSHNLAISALETATSAADALDLAPRIGMPVQNFFVADAAGRIGWTLTGNAMPRRAGFDPLRPADWSQPGSGWTGWAAPADYPRLDTPADGRLWTANNRIVGGAWLQLVGDGGYARGARARQIRDDLRARDTFTPRDLLAIQLDDRSPFLARWQTLLQTTLAQAKDAELVELRRLSADAPLRADADSVAYRLVRAFRTEVHKAALAPFIDRVQARFPDFEWPTDSEAAVWTLVQRRPAWLLGSEHADWPALLETAARNVTDELGARLGGLAARTWGERNTADIAHPLASALPAWLARHLAMPADPLPGDTDMPRVQAPDFGASQRFVIQPGNLEGSLLHMPGGQSAHPLSPFFGAGHAAWVHGDPTPLLPGPPEHRLELRPAGN